MRRKLVLYLVIPIPIPIPIIGIGIGYIGIADYRSNPTPGPVDRKFEEYIPKVCVQADVATTINSIFFFVLKFGILCC